MEFHFHATERLLRTYKYFILGVGETVVGEFTLAWKRSSSHGKSADKKETNVKGFKSKLIEIKRLAPDEFRNTLPYYVEEI